MKNILIITELFPPVPGIGGRRWAKFAKYFTLQGAHVHVICAPFDKEIHDESLWTDDVANNPQIHIHTHALKYPEILNTVPKSIIEKLNYKSAEAKLKMLTKGSIYDRTLFWGADYVELVEEMICKHQIDLIIATIAPVNLAYQIVPLKQKYPKVQFVADFRDPWTMSSSYGFPQVNADRQKEEERKEYEVCKHFDVITAPNQLILNDLSKLHQLPISKFYELIHAADSDDYLSSFQASPAIKSSNRKRIAIVGTMYENLQQEFDDLFTATHSLEDLEFHFYASNVKEQYLRKAKAEKVHFHQPLKPSLLFEELKAYDFLFIIYNKNMLNLMYTKVVEFICVKVPVVLIGQEGEASDFIIENGLGKLIKNERISEEVATILNNKFEINQDFDCSKFKFELVANNFIQRLEQLQHSHQNGHEHIAQNASILS